MRRGGPQTRGPRWSVSRSMSWRWSGSTFVTLAGAIGVAVCALYAWRRRGSPAAASLAVALLAATEWSLAHTLELSGGNLATRQLGGELRFIGTCLLPPACLIFMLQYSGRIRRPSRSMLALLAIEPLVVLTTLAIPATRHLMISWDPRAPGASPAAGGLGPSARPGPLYWVDFVYFTVLMWAFVVILAVTLARTSRMYRRQSAILFSALLARQRDHGRDTVKEARAAGGSYEVAISSLTDSLGQPTGQLLVARDVTERHRVDDMKKTFLLAVSHELRTPLAAVLGIAITLEHQQLRLDAANRADLLGQLASSARKLDRLLADLLDLDRLDRPTVTAERVRVDLGELVGQIVNEAGPELLDGCPVKLETRPLPLWVDAPKVERIVENLLANAARHTPPGTPVWVRVEPHDRGAAGARSAGRGSPAHAQRAAARGGTLRRWPRPWGARAGASRRRGQGPA